MSSSPSLRCGCFGKFSVASVVQDTEARKSLDRSFEADEGAVLSAPVLSSKVSVLVGLEKKLSAFEQVCFRTSLISGPPDAHASVETFVGYAHGCTNGTLLSSQYTRAKAFSIHPSLHTAINLVLGFHYQPHTIRTYFGLRATTTNT